MLITNDLISSLNPCKDRHDNYKNAYLGVELTLDDFLDSDKISYTDKIWVSCKLLTATQARTFAILCAESVLHIFEAKYPNNKAPRELLDYLKTIDWLAVTEMQQIEIKRLRYAAAAAAHAATYAADAAAAHAATAAADTAAAAASYDADAAASYAADAAASYAAHAADAASYDAADTAAAYAADAARKNQEDLNLTYLKMAFSLGAT